MLVVGAPPGSSLPSAVLLWPGGAAARPEAGLENPVPRPPARSFVRLPRGAARVETMFDRTRLPYVALDVFCVLLGTYARRARGVCAPVRGGVRTGVGRGLLEEDPRRAEEGRGRGGGVCLTPAPQRGETRGRLLQPGTPLCSLRPGSRVTSAACLSPAGVLSRPLLGRSSRLCAPCLAAVLCLPVHSSRQGGLHPLNSRETWSLVHQVL